MKWVASLGKQESRRRKEDPGESVDEVGYGTGKGREGEREKRGLRAEELVFMARCEKFSTIGGGKGSEWGEEKWEERAGHIRRVELIRRARAPQKLVEPSSIEIFDVLANALTRNKAQLFPTRRRPKLRALAVTDPELVESWFQASGISISSGLTSDQRARAGNLLYTWRDIFETDL